MTDEQRIETMTVVVGQPFKLPEGAVIIAAEPIHWNMDGKERRRVVYMVRIYGREATD